MEQEPPSAGTGSPHLDLLDAWLLSDRAPEDAMELSELDGFLTGIAVGPQTVMPSEWLPAIWGDAQPVFLTDTIGETIADFWAEGFLEAVGLRPAAWDPLFSHRDAGPLMMPILLLARGTEDLDLDMYADRLDGLLAEAPDMIVPCVVAIDRFWKLRRNRERVPKVRRNAPCPCGSGRKYKLCCGRS